jgi:hypothetical protein
VQGHTALHTLFLHLCFVEFFTYTTGNYSGWMRFSPPSGLRPPPPVLTGGGKHTQSVCRWGVAE